MDTEIKVGDEVAVRTIHPWTRNEVRLHKVTRVLKRYVQLDDDSKWQPNFGRYTPYPRRKGYQHSTMRLATDEDRDQVRRQPMIRDLCALKPENLTSIPTDDLAKILSLLKK